MKRLTTIGFAGLLTAGLAGCTGTIATPGPGSTTGNGTGNTTGPGTGSTTGPGPGNTGVPGAVCMPGVPTTTQLPRLTRSEYDNTIRDLLGIDSQPSLMLAPDTVGSVDQRAWDGIQAAADALSAQVIADATMKAKVIPCTPTGDGTACATQFIQTFGQRAFRRPMAAAEVARFQALYTNRAMITAAGTFDQAAQAILKAFLMSPSFLTKAELSEATPSNGTFALSGYEMASRLSYMLWGTMPDDMLFAAAAANKLATPADILAQAQRMLKDAKARAKIADFHQRYTLMGDATRWSEAAHDPTLFPSFKTTMVPTLAEETQKFFDYITFDQNGTFQDLITKPVAFVNKDLAPIYGLDPAQFGTDLTLTSLNPAQRSGVFTHAGFLASYSSYDRTSPILRGAFLEKQILCREIPAPPPGAASTPLPTTGSTNRDRVTAQTANEPCASCHATIVNPPGFALEAYDSIGAWQTTEKSTGAPLNTVADVAIGAKTAHVTGPVDLMAQIATSPEAQSCYAQRLVTYAFERDLTSQDVCTVQTLAGKMVNPSYNILSLITDLTQTQSFRFRAKELP